MMPTMQGNYNTMKKTKRHIMKVSKQSMEKLGFKKRTGSYWQHERITGLCFSELPSWDKIVFNAFQSGNKFGREQKQEEIKEALGIY